jgi:hypothetical protein
MSLPAFVRCLPVLGLLATGCDVTAAKSEKNGQQNEKLAICGDSAAEVQRPCGELAGGQVRVKPGLLT